MLGDRIALRGSSFVGGSRSHDCGVPMITFDGALDPELGFVTIDVDGGTNRCSSLVGYGNEVTVAGSVNDRDLRPVRGRRSGRLRGDGAADAALVLDHQAPPVSQRAGGRRIS